MSPHEAPPLLRLAIAGARGEAAAARRATRAARAAGMPRRALEEAGLMLLLYAGYPAALETLRALAFGPPRSAARCGPGRPPAPGACSRGARGGTHSAPR